MKGKVKCDLEEFDALREELKKLQAIKVDVDAVGFTKKKFEDMKAEIERLSDPDERVSDKQINQAFSIMLKAYADGLKAYDKRVQDDLTRIGVVVIQKEGLTAYDDLGFQIRKLK